MSGSEPITFTYKHVDDLGIQLDLYLPDALNTDPRATPISIPVLFNFHGGGLTVGNTRSWFPSWLKDRALKAGIAFISADYRLLPPSTAHDIVEDIQDVFRFVTEKLNPLLSSTSIPFHIDGNAIAVSGCSAGGLCAYLSVTHAEPRPKAVIALYAMGGDLLTPQYIQPKTEVFLRGREMLQPQDYSDYLYPQSALLSPTSNSGLAYHGPDAPIPGFPANPRMLLNRLYLQLGTYLDYYTGEHEPSLSQRLREAIAETPATQHEHLEHVKSHIPPKHIPLFPQFAVDSSWPPVFLAHGSQDSAVWMKESINLHRILHESGVPSVIRIIDGAEHSLDYVPNAEELYGQPRGLFDQVRDFLVLHLQSTQA
ncbi:alpha/beta-hydrolase [Trametopsis cervina]|nr:alpha/beta-hydrolase [Trametopsis cervina]